MIRFSPAIALALAGLLALAISGEALAKNDKAKGNGKPAHAGKSVGGSGNVGGGSSVDSAVGAAVGAATAILANQLLSPEDRRIIERYYQTHTVQAQALPPGIAKNVARGKPLPPGIAKKQVPGDLRTRVRIPYGYDLEQVGTDVLLIEAGTRVVAEILKGIVRN